MKSLSLSQPHMLVTVGIPGSGKSFFAERFSDMFHAPYISYEKIIDIADGNEEATGRYTTYLLHEFLKTGLTFVVDGLADTRAQRAELKHLAQSAGYKSVFIWVQTDAATAKVRALKVRRERGSSISPDEYEQLAAHFAPPASTERPIVISGKHTYATQAKVVLKNLAAQRHAPTRPASTERNDPPERRSIVIR